ncbi:unnamed protein product, partial [marine sediment metagenome]
MPSWLEMISNQFLSDKKQFKHLYIPEKPIRIPL